MLNCAPVIEAMAVIDFSGHRLEAWPTGGTEEGDSTKIYSQNCKTPQSLRIKRCSRSLLCCL